MCLIPPARYHLRQPEAEKCPDVMPMYTAHAHGLHMLSSDHLNADGRILTNHAVGCSQVRLSAWRSRGVYRFLESRSSLDVKAER